MPTHDIIVVGASAGGVETLRDLVRLFPADLPAAVLIVVHFPPYGVSMLPRILRRAGPLPADHAIDGETIKPGRIYVALPDHHLLVREGRIELTRGPKENRARPAIDPLFRSAAQAYGPRVVAVVLSGALADGTRGLVEVKQHGGITIAQDPDEAPFSSMPRTAIEHDHVDHVLPIAAIAPLLVRLAQEPPREGDSDSMPTNKDESNLRIQQDLDNQAEGERRGMVATYTCPECGGNLWEVDEQGVTTFQCHTGHALSAENLLVQQTEALEQTLWSGVRRLIEKSTLLRQMANDARKRGGTGASEKFEEKFALRLEAEARAAEDDSNDLRRLIQKIGESPSGESDNTSQPL